MPEPNQAQIAAEFARWRSESDLHFASLGGGTSWAFEAGFRAGWAARTTEENTQPADAPAEQEG